MALGWLGLALVVAAVVPMLDLDDWETGVAIWEAGLFASGAGLTFVLCAFAWQWGVGGLGPSSLALGVAGGLVDWLVVQAPTTASWPPAQAPIPAGPLPPGSHPADAATPALSSLSPSAPAAPSATKTGLSKADNEVRRPLAPTSYPAISA